MTPNAKSPLSDAEFTAFDLETAGLYPASCWIVEFGVVRFKLGKGELHRFKQLVDWVCSIFEEPKTPYAVPTGIEGLRRYAKERCRRDVARLALTTNH